MTEKTINILGHDVRMKYCVATETGFEKLTGKSINDISFDIREDLIALSLSAIVAAYTRTDEEPPINSNDLLYDAKPQEIVELIKAVIELRAEWYDIPKVVADELEKEADDTDKAEAEKNA